MCPASRPTRSRSPRTRSRCSLPRAMRWIVSASPTMAPAVMRGFSDEYGSWKMICMCRRSSRNSSFERLSISRPRNTIPPPVGSIRRRIERPAVVLPQPLSPTRPSVSFRPSVNEMPSTAFTCATTLRRSPWRTGKYFFRSATFRSGPSGDGAAAWFAFTRSLCIQHSALRTHGKNGVMGIMGRSASNGRARAFRALHSALRTLHSALRTHFRTQHADQCFGRFSSSGGCSL